MEIQGWIKRFHQEGRPGAYLKVLKTGTLGPGDAIEVVHRPDHEVSVGVMFAAQDSAKMKTMLAADVDLVDELREQAERIAARV
jgi:MOSC domain-containing protein YiiM